MILASTARDLHVVGGWLVIITNAVAGFWALAAHYREPFRRRELWPFTVVAQVLVTAQAIIGVVIQTQEDILGDSLGRHQHKVLMDHADTFGNSRFG